MAKLKLNKEFIEKAREYLVDGNYVITVSKLMGINEKTWYDWVNQGNRDIEEGKTSIFSKFCKMILEAEAEAEARNVKIIRTASETDWKAASWYLARKGKSKWLEKTEIELTVPVKAPTQAELEAEFNRFDHIGQAEVLELEEGKE